MRHRIFLVLVHVIAILLISISTYIFFTILNKTPLNTLISDVSIWAMTYFIAFTFSTGIYQLFLNKNLILWNILSSLSILAIVFCFVHFTWGWDWDDPKIYIAFLFFAIAGWLYPELFKIIRRSIEVKA